MLRRLTVHFGTVLALALGGLASPALAQPTAGPALASRADLEAALEQRNAWASSAAYSERLRVQARAEAELIRNRLRDGDFRVGDRMLLRVEGAVPFTDTVTVAPGQRITVPGLATVDVRGVLRSELQQRAQDTFRQTVLDATVSVHHLKRVAVFGTVARPGYQLLDFDARIDELVTFAGGPTAEGRPNKFTMMRADTVLFTPVQVTEAVARGLTISDLQLVDGDYLLVEPRSPPWDRGSIIGLVGIVLAPLIASLLLR